MLFQAGLSVRRDEADLVVEPADRITENMRRYIVDHKPVILDALAANDHRNDVQEQGRRKLATACRRIGADFGDCLSWYSTDLIDLAEMEPEALVATVRDYWTKRDWYRTRSQGVA